jgi:hypothetical protein
MRVSNNIYQVGGQAPFIQENKNLQLQQKGSRLRN